MPSWAQQKANLRTAIAANRRPRFTDDGRQILSLGQGRSSYALLSQADGQLTRAGKFFSEETRRQRPNSSYDPDQPLTGHNDTAYITFRNSTQRAVRTLQTTGSFKLTRLGKTFFKNKYSEFIAHIPVIIQGVQARGRAKGSTYERLDYMPASVLGANRFIENDALSEQDKVRNMKARVSGPPAVEQLYTKSRTKHTSWTTTESGRSRP